MKYSLGIDLGTTFSVVAVVDETGQPRVLKNRYDKTITPSVIYFGPEGPVVGEEAKELQTQGEEDVIAFFKRSMGDRHFEVAFHGKTYTPVDLSALVLKALKADAEQVLGQRIDQAVITVPAYFDNFQRQATIEAGKQAGLDVLRIIHEPTAAALAYGIRKLGGDATFLVYDLGGGTFDVSLVKSTAETVVVLGTAGDHELGGKDWDDRIAIYLGEKFAAEHGANPLDDTTAFQDLLVRCENAKKQLSTMSKVRITLRYQGIQASYELTRDHFETITRDLMERTEICTQDVLEKAGMSWSQLDGVLLVGGSTRMPMIERFVETMSGKPPLRGINVDEAVAIGAAIQAQVDGAENTPQTPNSQFVIAGAKKIQDVISHSLGMVAESKDRLRYLNSRIILKNRPIPCAEAKTYELKTRQNGNNLLEVYMLQGESDVPLQCSILGKYVFSGIDHVAQGTATIEVSFAYDRNGVVTVAATQQQTGKKLPYTIEPVPEDMSWLGIAPADRQQHQQPVHLAALIAIDLSGSMYGEPLTGAQQAARSFVDRLDMTNASVGLLAFADQVRITQGLCQDPKKLHEGINAYQKLMKNFSVGGGNMAEPFTQSLAVLGEHDGPGFLIVLTDGCWAQQQKAIQRAKKCHQAGIEVIAIGFGGADEEFLRAIATSDENALFTDLSQLVDSFSHIAQVLTDTGGQLSLSSKTTKKGGINFF